MKLPTEKIVRIRDLYLHAQLPIARIADEAGVSRNTVYKYVNMEDFSSPMPGPQDPAEGGKKAAAPSILDPYKDTIREWLEADRKENIKQRHTNQRVYDRLVDEEGFKGSRSTVDNYVRELRKEMGVHKKKTGPDGYLNLGHWTGEAQADFGKARFEESGESHYGSFFALSFPQSNAAYAQLTYGENLECVLESLQAIFGHLGGVPKVIWFDNASSIVRILLNDRQVSERFQRFATHYGFRYEFMNRGKGNEKGNVENFIGTYRSNHLVPVPRFRSLGEKNKEMLSACDESFSGKVHYRTGVYVSELFQKDRDALLPLPKVPFITSRVIIVKTDKCGIFTLDNGLHRYSSAPCHSECELQVRLSAGTVEVRTLKSGLIVTHPRLYGGEKDHMEHINYLPYLKYIARKPRSFSNMPIREMMPGELCAYIDSLSDTGRGKVLEELCALTEKEGFAKAVQLAAERLSKGTGRPEPSEEAQGSMGIPGMEGLDFGMEGYDGILKGGRNDG